MLGLCNIALIERPYRFREGPRTVCGSVIRIKAPNLFAVAARITATCTRLLPAFMPGDPGRDRALGSFAEQLADRQRKRARRIDLKIIGSNEHFNFVKAGDQFVAVSKSLGPTALYAECLGERDLGTLILVAASYDEVRRRADETEA